jgi:GNAT superfamily N-acetyltransferase
MTVRPIQQTDFEAWLPLWHDYNAFYGRHGETALAPAITQATWQRFFDPLEPVFALVAELDGQLLGLTCYLQDLFTDPAARGKGVGRALIQGVYEQARAAGITRVYWQTHQTNAAGRLLYDKVAKHMGFTVYSQDV